MVKRRSPTRCTIPGSARARRLNWGLEDLNAGGSCKIRNLLQSLVDLSPSRRSHYPGCPERCRGGWNRRVRRWRSALIGCFRVASQDYHRRVYVPEIALHVSELDAHFPVPPLRFDVHHAAFPLFSGVGVHEQQSLPALDACREWQQTTMNAHAFCLGEIAEGTIVERAAIHTHRNAQWQALTSPMSPVLRYRPGQVRHRQ